MRLIAGIFSLALLMWVEAASAQKTYSLSVSRHRAVPALSEGEVNGILVGASKMLQKNVEHVVAEILHFEDIRPAGERVVEMCSMTSPTKRSGFCNSKDQQAPLQQKPYLSRSAQNALIDHGMDPFYEIDGLGHV